jgi:short subunit dehydrogenase-like uncharacterized protein
MSEEILIYGANGYTAELIIELAVAAGARPILAGRSAAKIAPLAQRFDLPMRCFALDVPAVVARNLAGVSVVLNCAGPFARTAHGMAQACIAAGVHYLDITGEIDVFESLAATGAQAAAAGVMLMPGVGFDVVPSDCLAAHLKRRLPEATQLTLAFQAIGRPSHGTATTIIENLHRGGRIRRSGRIVDASAMTRTFDFGRGPTPAVGIPWGDVATAWYSTGIPDIEVFMAAPLPLRAMMGFTRLLPGLVRSPPVQGLLKRVVDAAPAGPSAEERRRGRALLWGEARNAAGQAVRARIETLESYALTAITAWDIASRVAHDKAAQPGFRTPSLVFGADYILGVPGTTRTDL